MYAAIQGKFHSVLRAQCLVSLLSVVNACLCAYATSMHCEDKLTCFISAAKYEAEPKYRIGISVLELKVLRFGFDVEPSKV